MPHPECMLPQCLPAMMTYIQALNTDPCLVRSPVTAGTIWVAYVLVHHMLGQGRQRT